MISDILDPEYPHTTSYVSHKTGMRYKTDGKGVHTFSIRGQQRPMIPKATEEAKAWARALHDGGRKRVAPHRYKGGNRPLRTEEWTRFKPCPKCGEWIGWLPCRKCGNVGLKEEPICASAR